VYHLPLPLIFSISIRWKTIVMQMGCILIEWSVSKISIASALADYLCSDRLWFVFGNPEKFLHCRSGRRRDRRGRIVLRPAAVGSVAQERVEAVPPVLSQNQTNRTQHPRCTHNKMIYTVQDTHKHRLHTTNGQEKSRPSEMIFVTLIEDGQAVVASANAKAATTPALMLRHCTPRTSVSFPS